MHRCSFRPPPRLRRYVIPMLGIYPARGCPFTCNFCSVIKIAGRQIRSQSIETTMESLRKAKEAGVRLVMFTSDNFNKYSDAPDLLEQMIEEKIRIPFFVQCDTQVSKQEEFVSLLGEPDALKCLSEWSRSAADADCRTQGAKSSRDVRRDREAVRQERHRQPLLEHHRISGRHRREHSRTPGSTAWNESRCRFVLHTDSDSGNRTVRRFSGSGLDHRTNLDRFDATTTTWRHPNLSSPELQNLLFECYRKFFSTGHILNTAFRTLRHRQKNAGFVPYFGQPLFSRLSAGRRTHPMSGGIGRVRLDSDSDYRELRRDRFDVDLVPLPKSLTLSKADEELNRRAKIAI